MGEDLEDSRGTFQVLSRMPPASSNKTPITLVRIDNLTENGTEDLLNISLERYSYISLLGKG
jgi:hypothetical protein